MGLRVKGESPQESFAKPLRDARSKVDQTQDELARHFGVSLRTIQLWEAGQTPSAKHRRALRDFIRFVECEEAA